MACLAFRGMATPSLRQTYVSMAYLSLHVLTVPTQMNRYFSLASADLVVPRQEAWGLLADFTTLREIADTLPGNGSLQNKAIVVANEIMNIFDNNDVASIGRARKHAEEVFGEGWEKKGEKIYDEGAERAQVWGIGYCHIDTAWYGVTQHGPETYANIVVKVMALQRHAAEGRAVMVHPSRPYGTLPRASVHL